MWFCLRNSLMLSHTSAAVASIWVRRLYVHCSHCVFSWRMNRRGTCTLGHNQQQQQEQLQFSAARCAVTQSTAVDSDFVDLGLDNSVSGNTYPALPWEEQSTLGVTRTPEVPDGQEYSRLHIPLTHPRAGRPELRPNSRSIVLLDDAPCVSNGNDNDNGDGDSYGNLSKEQASSAKGANENEASLPYDDELFAEMLLQMEVEGAIDEAWQDTRKAHIEDVMELVEVLRSLKVRDVCAIDVSAKTNNFDYMIFGTCEGPRHIHLAAWATQEADSLKRICKIKRKQTDHTWEVVPVGRIIVNLMQESLREEMTLERKWAVTKSMDPLAAANAPVSEGRQVKAHGLWTLTLNLQDLEDFEVDYCKDILMRQL